MKKFNILLAILCIITLSSCDDFLDKKPTNSGDSNSAIKTERDAQIMMNGVMDGMRSSTYLGRNMFLYADAKGGDLTIAAQGRGNDALYSFNHSVNTSTYSGFWTLGYNLILQLNSIIATIDELKATGTEEYFDTVLGQAYTLRAMLYFDLVRLYGKPYNYDKSAWGVPDVTTVLDASARELRATVEQNYKTIISDLETGATLLQNDKDPIKGNVNYYANKVLQARVYLAMDNFDAALTAAEEVINDEVYELYSNSKWVESWSKQYGSESIFEIPMLDTENDLGSGSLGGYYARYKDYGTALGYFIASDYFLDRLGEDPDDIRWGVMTYDELSETRMGCCYKYLGGVGKPGDGKSSASAVNVKVMRLSEVYLIAAEAALRKSTPDKGKSVGYLNEIRKRSPNLAPATEGTVTLDMILDEKSKELYGEGHRFWDMIRCNKSITFNDEIVGITLTHREKTIDRTFYKTILPIFRGEILANPAIGDQQNPGY